MRILKNLERFEMKGVFINDYYASIKERILYYEFFTNVIPYIPLKEWLFGWIATRRGEKWKVKFIDRCIFMVTENESLWNNIMKIIFVFSMFSLLFRNIYRYYLAVFLASFSGFIERKLCFQLSGLQVLFLYH